MEPFHYADWERREAYEFFSTFSNPFYMVTFQTDITELYNYTKAHGLSFYCGMIWACTEAINRVRAFRVSLENGKLALLDGRHPSFTDLKPGAEQFHIVTMKHLPTIEAFCEEAGRRSKAQTFFVDLEQESDALIYYTCLPWIELTALTNERDLSDPKAADDSIPRISWGKYKDENGRKTIGISVEVNHRFIDGLHIGQFAAKLEHCIRQLQGTTVPLG